ncbi:MAG: TIM barrel protein, partial [Mariniphaga sp.]
LRNISSIKEEILLRPTFFQHFDRVVIDWKYLQQKEKSFLAEESGWIKRQGLKLIVDFSSGINLFPDLRLVNNHPEYAQSMATIKSVIEKLNILGAKDMIITTHRKVENNYSEQQFDESIRKSVKEICQNATKYGINVHLRITPGSSPYSVKQSQEFVEKINEPNFYVAPSTALILYNQADYKIAPESLKNMKMRILLVSAPETDPYGKLWNVNMPIHNFPNKQAIKQVLGTISDCVLLLDGIYDDKNEEYLDIKSIINL